MICNANPFGENCIGGGVRGECAFNPLGNGCIFPPEEEVTQQVKIILLDSPADFLRDEPDEQSET